MTIITGDCLTVLRGMESESVNCVWTDPPYNVGKDYGVFKDNLPDRIYLKNMRNVIRELKRVSGNKIAMMIPTKYGRQYWNMLGPGYRQIILSYSPSGAIRYNFSNQFSFILTNMKPNMLIQNVWHNVQYPGLGYFFREDTFGHPGYTSEDLTGRVIKYFTNKGDTILDPYGGSGTTEVMAKRLERKCISIELNPSYISKTETRIAATVVQEKLFGEEI